ncbi:MAG: hypothetical protein KatS3mg082_3272 [Nitrospiraceae bacterium]|nr:MAG: hypothetical protein KatS3mg082_3272 [Nitrospiraceae bacterium]
MLKEPPLLTRPTRLDRRYLNRCVVLPYGLKVEEVEKDVAPDIPFHSLNEFLQKSGFRPLEQLLLPPRTSPSAGL